MIGGEIDDVPGEAGKELAATVSRAPRTGDLRRSEDAPHRARTAPNDALVAMPDDDAPPTVPAPPLPPPPKRRLLIIDDEPAVSRSIARALKHVCDATMVTDGAAALSRLAAGERYDLVLCDVMMPGMTGIELYAILREKHTNVLPRMFFMTGGVFQDEAAAFLDALAQPPLQKPIDKQKLASVLR